VVTLVTPEKLGSVVGGAFGLIFVMVNTGHLAGGVAWALRLSAVVVFVVVVLGVLRPTVAVGGGRSAISRLSRRYWVVLAAEVGAILVGLPLFRAALHRPTTGVPWIATVVGAHFLGLAVLWHERIFYWLGGLILACGALGLSLEVIEVARPTVEVTAGVLPGCLLLTFGLWGSVTARSLVPRRPHV
jgi:hypothetical protein